jgi:predicted GNAT family acetyltransferase
MPHDLEIRHDPTARRFEAIVDGHVCELDYLLRDGVMSIVHTGVPTEVGGRGIAARLVEAAFEVAQVQGWKVRPACSYAADWARRHPERAADILA